MTTPAPAKPSPINMLDAAMQAANDGWYIFPLHTPLFDHPAGHTCSCEDYRHTDACRQRDADRKAKGKPPLYLATGEHCDKPGKHPRVNWRSESTQDPKTIAAWWKRFPTASVGGDTGKSDKLVLDADLYKETYSGAELWEDATRTQNTGGGGRHVIFDRQGKPYGNQAGALPAGIDIRGVGGYIVLAPSLHASGRRYEWANDKPYAPMPDELDRLLAAAREASKPKPRQPVQPTNIDDTELLERMFSAKNGHQVRALWDGHDGGDHSAADYRLCRHLAFWTGRDEDRIDRLFRLSGLYRSDKWERDDYRRRTIGKAIDDTSEVYDPQRMAPPVAAEAGPSVRAILDATRLRLRGLDFALLVPAELQAANGYRTDATDRIIADHALAIAMERNSLVVRVSSLQLAERTGRSFHTCKTAMKRLCWLFAPLEEPVAKSKDAPLYEIRVAQIAISKGCAEEISRSTQLPLATHAGRDAFVRSLTRMTPDAMDARIAARNDEIAAAVLVHQAISVIPTALQIQVAEIVSASATVAETIQAIGKAMEDIPVDQSLGDGIPRRLDPRRYRTRLDALTDSAGPGVLLVVDALVMYGALDRTELAIVMHRKKHSVSRIVARGIALEILVEDGNRIDVAPDWQGRTDIIDATAPTAGTMQRRRLAVVDSRLRYTEAALNNPYLSPDDRDAMYRRKNRAQVTKLRLVKDGADEHNERRSAAGVPQVDKTVILAPGSTYEDYLRWQRQLLADQSQAKESLRSLAGDLAGLDYEDAKRVGQIAGYTAAEVAQAMSYRPVV